MPNSLYLYGDIGRGWWSDDGIVDSDVQVALASLPSSDGLDIHINTYGGDISMGLTIMNMIRAYSSKHKALNSSFVTRTIVDGFAYSIGSVLMLAADVRIMNPGTKAMVHNPLSMEMGDYREMLKAAERLKKTREDSIALYIAACGKDAAAIGQMMDDETYLSADEALQLGLATEVVKLETPKKESNSSPQEGKLLVPSAPYEANQKMLEEVAKQGRGAYQKSLMMVKKKSSSSEVNSFDLLHKEIELLTLTF